MQTFNNYFDLLKSVNENGKKIKIRNLYMKELINVNLTIDNPLKCLFYVNKNKRNFDYVSKYLKGELCWYLNGSNKINDIYYYSNFWRNICDSDGNVNSNYGYHVFYKKIFKNITNYKNCLNILTNDVNSRRAIVLYNEPQFMFNNEKDYLCTQNQQFLVRDNVVNSIVSIRSSDAVFGLTYDIPWWSFVQQKIAKDLNKKIGYLSINIGSSHIYDKFFSYCDSLEYKNTKTGIVKITNNIIFKKSFKWYEKNINAFVSIKK